MDGGNELEAALRALPPDGSFLVMNPETESFFKAETGIQDSEELRKHMIEVQEEAYKVSHRRSANSIFPHVRSNGAFCS